MTGTSSIAESIERRAWADLMRPPSPSCARGSGSKLVTMTAPCF